MRSKAERRERRNARPARDLPVPSEIVRIVGRSITPEQEEVFKGILVEVKQKALERKVKTVAKMVEEQKFLRIRKVTERIPMGKGLGGKRESWWEYYSWLDVMEVIAEEEKEEGERRLVVHPEVRESVVAVDRATNR